MPLFESTGASTLLAGPEILSPIKTEMFQDSKITLHGHAYSLRTRPPTTSPLVQASRTSLLLDLQPELLSRDVHKLAVLLENLGEQLNSSPDKHGLKRHMRKAKSALLTSVQIPNKIHKGSELILQGQKDIIDAVEQQQSSAVQGLLQRSEKLVESLLSLLSVACNATTKVIDLVGESIDDILASIIESEYDARKLSDSLIEVRATRAKALLAHNALVERMIATGKEYARAACEERRVWRLAMAAKTMRLATWVKASMCGEHFSWSEPDPAQCIADNALIEKKKVMLKRFQAREEAYEMLRIATESENALQIGLREMHVKKMYAEQTKKIATMAKNMMVTLMRLGSFWTQTKSELENVLSDTRLLRQFFYRACHSPGPSSRDAVLNAADVSVNPVSKPGRALTRSIVQLFARWVAIADVFNEVLQGLHGVKAKALFYSGNCDESVNALLEVVETRMEEMRTSSAACKV